MACLIGSPASRHRTVRSQLQPVQPELLDHLDFLVSIGMGGYMIARAAGVSPGCVRRIRTGVQSTSTLPIQRALMAVTPRPMKHQALVLGYGANRRLESLAVNGWSASTLAEEMNVNRVWPTRLRTTLRLTWETHLAVDAVYARLSHIDGGNEITKVWAAAKGFVPPMMWDDIDDYYETPTVPVESSDVDEVVVRRLLDGRRVDSATQAERAEAAQVLLGRGELSQSQIAALIGVSMRTVARHSATVRDAA